MSLESEERRVYQAQQSTLVKIMVLEKQKALGLISDDEFRERCKAAFGM